MSTPAASNQIPPHPLERLLNGDVPTRGEFVSHLSQMDPLQAILLLAFGLVCMLQGWKLFKVVVVVNAGILGAILGTRIGQMLSGGPNLPVMTAVAGGLLLAALAWPMMKYAVSVCGALIGAFFGYNAWAYLSNATGQLTLATYAWAGGLLGLITMGLLAFIVFKATVMIFTSIQGSMLSVSGALAMLMKYNSFRPKLVESLSTDLHMFPLLVMVPAIIGLAVQQSSGAKKGASSKKS